MTDKEQQAYEQAYKLASEQVLSDMIKINELADSFQMNIPCVELQFKKAEISVEIAEIIGHDKK